VKTQRSRSDWIEAALTALADQGEPGLAVEPLAAALGVTKGSFYWHFADREALLAALLAAFEARGADEVIAALAAVEDAAERLARLFTVAFGDGRGLRAERALLGMQHPLVRSAVARVHGKRRAFLEASFADLGCSRERARHFAATTYAAYLGAVTLADEAPWADDRARRAWVEHLVALVLSAAR
jgi:AcrR family transcriptional regulator